MENYFTCVKCGTDLPRDKPEDKRYVRCIFCSCPNPNPNFSEASASLDSNDENQELPKRRNRVINIERSSFAQLIAVGILLASTLLSFAIYYSAINKWVYLIIAVILLLPAIRDPFVKAHWDSTLVKLSSRSQERYSISSEYNYTLHYIVSNVYVFFFIYRAFFNSSFSFDFERIRVWPIIISFAISTCTVWLAGKIISVLGEYLGHAFPKE